MSSIEWKIEKFVRKYVPHDMSLGEKIVVDGFSWPEAHKGEKLYLEGTQYKVTEIINDHNFVLEMA